MKSKIEFTYSQISAQPLRMALAKISNAPIANNKIACMIRGVNKAVRAKQEEIGKEYEDSVLHAFAKKNEDGSFVRPDGNPQAYDVDDTKVDEFKVAQEEFGKKTLTIEYGPLRPSHLEGIALSANELDALGDLFVEDDGPGLSVVE